MCLAIVVVRLGFRRKLPGRVWEVIRVSWVLEWRGVGGGEGRFSSFPLFLAPQHAYLRLHCTILDQPFIPVKSSKNFPHPPGGHVSPLWLRDLRRRARKTEEPLNVIARRPVLPVTLYHPSKLRVQCSAFLDTSWEGEHVSDGV